MGRIRDAIDVLRGRKVIREAEKKFDPVAPYPSDVLPKRSNNVVNDDNFENFTYGSLNDLTSLSERRNTRYTVYDAMRQNDSLAAAVLEIYADDITLPNPQGNAIWVESEDAQIADAGNRILRILKIEKNLWATAYSLVLYGDVYFELFRNVKSASLFNEAQVVLNKEPRRYTIQDYVDRVSDPSEMYDLTLHGQTVGFARTHINEDKVDIDAGIATSNVTNQWIMNYKRGDIDIYDSRKFIHIYVPDAAQRHPYKLIVSSDDEGNAIEYEVASGKSLLQDAYKVSQQLQLMETSILLSRLTRSSIYRLIKVAVGQKSENDVRSILLRVKTLFDKKQTINSTTGTFASYANPGPDLTNIVVPVKDNGQGDINADTVGGDYDPHNLSDLDYLVNKELAAFKVPRQYLNFTDGGGFNGGSSLAKISAQYAHRIVRYKRAISEGFETLLNIYFENRNPDYVGKFEVKMTPITTVEDAERVAMANDKLGMVSMIMDQLDKMDDTIGKFKILKDAFEDAYPNSVVSQVLDDYIKKLELGFESKPSGGEGDDLGGGGGSFSSGSSFDDLDEPADLGGEEESDDSFASDEGEEGSGSEFPTDLSGDIDYTDTAAIDAMLGSED